MSRYSLGLFFLDYIVRKSVPIPDAGDQRKKDVLVQAARVLLITSHESEPPAADFLNHTLLALAAVGSHLASARPNSKASLHLLVQRFNIGRQTGNQVDYGSVKKVHIPPPVHC